MDNELLNKLQSKQRDELNIIAKRLKIKSYRRLNKDKLIEKFLEIDETHLKKHLTITWWDKYHNHVYGGGGLLLGIVCVFLFFLPQGDISVVPKTRPVSPGINQKFILKILNNKDYPIYQVDLRVCVENGDLSLKDIKLNLKQETKLSSDVGGVVVSHDIFGIRVIEEDGTKADHKIIYDVDAHSTKEFEVEVNAENIREKSIISFKIVRIDKEPTQIISFDPFRLCQDDDKNFKTYHETSKTMLSQKRYKEALVCCEKAIIKDPNSYKAYNNMGIALLFLNEKDKAIEKFEKAIELDPTQPKTYLNLAGILLSERRFDDAIRKLEHVTKIKGPEQLDAYILWGRCLALKNDYTGAVEKYKKATVIDPEYGPAYYRWGLLLKNNGNCEKAIIKFQKATESDHEFKLDSYGMWGACLEDIGLYKESLEKCQLIIDIAPNSKEAKRSENSIKMVKEKIQDNEIKK